MAEISGNTESTSRTELSEYALQYAEIERLQTFDRLRSSFFDAGGDDRRKKIMDVTKLEAVERHAFIEKLIKNVENDNLQLLQKIRNRIDK